MPARLFVLLGALVAMNLFAGEQSTSPRPVCKADRAGQFWPDAANTDQAALAKFARDGDLQVCSRGTFRYQWHNLTLSAKPKPSPHEAGSQGEAGRKDAEANDPS